MEESAEMLSGKYKSTASGSTSRIPQAETVMGRFIKHGLPFERQIIIPRFRKWAAHFQADNHNRSIVKALRKFQRPNRNGAVLEVHREFQSINPNEAIPEVPHAFRGSKCKRAYSIMGLSISPAINGKVGI